MSCSSLSRKRKADNMGGFVSKLSASLFGGEKAEETPSSSKAVDDNCVEEAEETPSSSNIADDDSPPVLDRGDAKSDKELPLDDTPECSPDPSPAKKKPKEEKKADAEASDEDGKKDKNLQKQSSSSSLTRRRKKTIADMGYHFKDGQLRSIDGDGPFKFTTQKAYEELGDLIGEYVYDLMEETGLKKIYFEAGVNGRFYFASPDYEKKERILVLIHGSGVVKAGQWARKLIINESLSRGTQLDYIKRGLALDWGVVVLNYNEKCVGKEQRCHSPNVHGMAEWKHAFGSEAAGDSESPIVVVAHSAGGSVISDAVRWMLKNDDNRVLFVGLTDSWFSEGQDVCAVNWNTTKKQLYRSSGIWQMYSGDDTHEGTSAACINSVFALLEGISMETSKTEFCELLEASEQIVLDEMKERSRKKKEQQSDNSSAKSLELEEKEKEQDKKEVEKEKIEKEEQKKKTDEDSVGVKKEDDEKEEATQEKEKVDKDEGNTSDYEEKNDERVEKDVSSPKLSDNDK